SPVQRTKAGTSERQRHHRAGDAGQARFALPQHRAGGGLSQDIEPAAEAFAGARRGAGLPPPQPLHPVPYRRPRRVERRAFGAWDPRVSRRHGRASGAPLLAWAEALRARRKQRRRLARRAAALGFGIVLLGATAVAPPAPRLVWNASASAPVGLYAV